MQDFFFEVSFFAQCKVFANEKYFQTEKKLCGLWVKLILEIK